MSDIYKNIKKGSLYKVLRFDVINCTNANDNQIMVLYQSMDEPNKIFVREINEFKIKFEKID